MFTVPAVAVLPTNMLPAVTLPEIKNFVTSWKVTRNPDPVDVVPLFHVTDRTALLGFEYAMSCAQFSLSVILTSRVRSPLVISGVPVQPESLPATLILWASLTVGDTGGDKFRLAVKVVQVNTLAEAGDDVVDPEGAELLDEDPHADSNTMTAISVPVETTRCLRMRVSSVLVKKGAGPYISSGDGVTSTISSGGGLVGDPTSR